MHRTFAHCTDGDAEFDEARALINRTFARRFAEQVPRLAQLRNVVLNSSKVLGGCVRVTDAEMKSGGSARGERDRHAKRGRGVDLDSGRSVGRT